MNKLFMIVICIVVLIIASLLSWRLIYKKSAIEKVKKRTDEEKLKDINEACKILFIQVCIHCRESLVIVDFMMN